MHVHPVHPPGSAPACTAWTTQLSGEYYCRLNLAHEFIRHYLMTERKYMLVKKYAHVCLFFWYRRLVFNCDYLLIKLRDFLHLRDL